MASFDFTLQGVQDVEVALLALGRARVNAILARYVAQALRDELPSLRRLLPERTGRLRSKLRITRTAGNLLVIRANVFYARFTNFVQPTRLGTETVVATFRAWIRQGYIRFAIEDAMRRAIADILAGRT